MSNVEDVYLVWENAVAGKLPEVHMTKGLAEHWLHLYGLPVIEAVVPRAIDKWVQKCQREKCSPIGDLDYLRNYLMSWMRAELNQKLVLDESVAVDSSC